MAQLITIANQDWATAGILQGTTYESLQLITPPNPITAVACDGNGTYIAIRNNTTNIYKSTDHLQTLTPISLLNTPFLYGNCWYFDGKFVVYGYYNGYPYCYYSSDGDSWNRTQIPTAQYISGGTFEPLGIYMVFYGDPSYDGSTKDIYYSSDLITWTTANVHTTNDDPVDVGGSFGNGQYLIRYDNGPRVYRATTINGAYTNVSPAGLLSVNSVRYGNSKFVLVDWADDKLYQSATGDNGSWSEITYNASFPLLTRYSKLHFDTTNNLFVMVRGTKGVHISSDGENWTSCLSSPGITDSDYHSSIAISIYEIPTRNYLYKTEDDVITITIPDPPDAFFPSPTGFASSPAKFPPPGGSSPPPSSSNNNLSINNDVIIFTGTNSNGQNTVVVCDGGNGCIRGTQQPDGTYQPD